MKYKIIKKCQICEKKLFDFLNLGKQPLCDDLTKKPNNSKFYKLQVSYCKNCLTAFQKYNIQKKILFPKTYHYRSANTKDVLDGMQNLVLSSKKYFSKIEEKTVLDIGCNDGSLLSLFKKQGCKTYGIEPTGAYREAQKKGHKIFNSFFNLHSSTKIKKIIGKIDIITFTNVFAHIDDLKNLLLSLKNICDDHTLLIIENHYFGEVIKKNQFDTFYHEHPRTYSLKSFVKISEKMKMKIIDYKFVKRYNGNIRIYLSYTGKVYKTKNDIQKKLISERSIINQVRYLQKKVDYWRLKKKKQLHKIVKEKGPIAAKAFPGRASIILNLLKLDSNFISFIYEKNSSLKNNKYAPGTNIKIVKEKFFSEKEKQKKVIINLAWHISSEIKKYLSSKLKYSGKIIDIISKSDFK